LFRYATHTKERRMAHENDPHDREYAGAIAGMHDTYGFPIACTLPSVGDRIAYRLKTHTDEQYEAGRVVRVNNEGERPLVVVESEGAEGTLRVLDARPWPTGQILPF
jgi:hypothetical protein